MKWDKIEEHCYQGISDNRKYDFVIDSRTAERDGFIAVFVFDNKIRDEYILIDSFECESFEEAFRDCDNWI